MATHITLLVDPPMPGESMSSFLGRAAQAYCTPQRTLFLELTNGAKECMRPDVDRWPTAQLLSVLAAAVPNWRSPQDELQPFLNWVLAPTKRKAYCPTCFVEDLAANTTPYFRQDWMAVICTHCWKHESPLHDWQWCDATGARKLPICWVLKMDFSVNTYPAFMAQDLKNNQVIAEAMVSPIEAESLAHYLQLLKRLQWIIEKPAACTKAKHFGVDEFSPLHSEVYGLIKFATAHRLQDHKNGPIAGLVYPRGFDDWFGGEPRATRAREYEFSSNALRQAGDLSWRRSYLSFAMRTLAGSDFFHRTYLSSLPKCTPWQGWWDDEVAPLCVDGIRRDLDHCRQSLIKSDTCKVL